MRIATLLGIYHRCSSKIVAIQLRSLLVGICLVVAVYATGQAAGLAQLRQVDGSHLYLTPNQTTGVELVMHHVVIRLAVQEDERLALSTVAEYRLQNSGASPVQLSLLLGSEAAGTVPVRANGVTLSANGQQLGLEPNQSGELFTQVVIQADSSATLLLQYQSVLQDADIVQMRYVPNALDVWPGRPSVRVNMVLPNSIDSASWLRLQPAGWSYGATADVGTVDIKWLYDGLLPKEALAVSFIGPGLWQQIQTLTGAATNAPSAATYEQLGSIYRRLHVRSEIEEVRNRFYAQAVAAYSAGLEAPDAGGDGEIITSIHIGLAALYRNRAATTVGNLSIEYARLMVAEAEAALAQMQVEDTRRRELQQWQADGLRVQLAQAQVAHDWVTALKIVDTLSALPTEVADATELGQQRRLLQIQQALQLMARGDRSGAEALAGSELDDTDLAPPPELVPIFAGWQISVTIDLQRTTMRALVVARESRVALAESALTAAIQGWQSVAAGHQGASEKLQISLTAAEHDADYLSSWLLEIVIHDAEVANQLATLLPSDANWALLRALLAQLSPNTNVQRQLIRDQVRMTQPLDLRPAGDQWSAMASSLERRATEFLAPLADQDRVELANAESQLQAQIRAANYRTVAVEWQTLARQSWVLYVFDAGPSGWSSGSDGRQQRSWYATVSTPSQILALRTQVIDAGRVISLSMGSFLLLIVLAGYLWWLM